MYKNLAATLVAACCLFPAVSPLAQTSSKTAEPLKAGFVYVSPITEAGWTRQHDEGRKAKYLEDPHREESSTMLAIVAAEVRRALR